MNPDIKHVAGLVLLLLLLLPGTGCVGSASRAIPITAQSSALVRQGRYDEAIANLSKAAKDYPDKGYVWYWLAEAHKGKRDYSSAIKCFEKALSLELSPGQKKSAYGDLGWCYCWTLNYPKAIDSFSEALKLDPRWKDAIFGRAFSYKQIGRFQEAIEDFTKHLELEPNYKGSIVARAWCYFYMRRYKEGLADFNRAEALEAGTNQYWLPNILTGQGWCNYGLGNFKVALAKFNQALKVLAPGDKKLLWLAHKGMAFVQAALGNYRASFKAIEKARAARDYDTHWDLAMLHYVAGNKQAAWKLIGGAGYLGATLQQLPHDKGRGVTVVRVDPGGPAQRAGVHPGDVIVEFQGRSVADLQVFVKQVKATPPGTRGQLVVKREGRQVRIPVIMGQADGLMRAQPLLAPIFKYGKPRRAATPTVSKPRMGTPSNRKRARVVTARPISKHLPHIPKTTRHIAHIPKQHIKHIPKQPKLPATSSVTDKSTLGQGTMGTGAGHELVTAKPLHTSSGFIQIDQISAVPKEVSAGEAFQMVVDFTIKDPKATGKELPFVVERTIYRGGQVFHRFQPIEKTAPNGKPWQLIFSMTAATERGKYTMEMVLRYKNEEVRKTALFVIK